MINSHQKVREKIDSGKIKYLGGDGSSLEKAILISGKIKTGLEGIDAEYYYLFRKLGEMDRDWKMVMQFLVHGEDGKPYDRMDVKDLKNHTEATYYFDISEFFGK